MMIAAMAALAATCVAVDGDRILISDLARAVPAFATAPQEDTFGLAPMPGVRRLAGPAEIARLAARYGLQVPGSASACFVRTAEVLTAEQVETGLRKVMGEVEWKLIDFCRYPAPRGTLEFLPPPKLRSGSAPVIVRGRVNYGDGRNFPVWARVNVSLPPREIERGDSVSVEVTSGGAMLKLDARAESGGQRGENVVLRNLSSNKCFTAQVAGKGKAILDAQQTVGRAARNGAR